MVRIHVAQKRYITILYLQKVSHSERVTHNIDNKKMFCLLCVLAKISLLNLLCEQTNQSPVIMFIFMDMVVFKSHYECVSGHINNT